MTDQRDSIDFGKENIPRLFIKLFVPTLFGMIFMALFNVVDGIVVGRGVGSDALAAVNVAAPIFMISSATALMFAVGVSVVGAIHLSHGDIKAANINVTQAFEVPLILMVIIATIIFIFAKQLCYVFGGSDLLCPYVVSYIRFVAPSLIFMLIEIIGGFVARLDGSPKYSMLINVIPALLNIALDIIMVFSLHLGIGGAALATTISCIVGAAMTVVYMFWFSSKLHFYKLKMSKTSLMLTLRNVGYMIKMGFATFIGEGAISGMIIVGNFMFMRLLHEDGVAAFSFCCYLFPLVFMFGNSIAQAQLPIVSYNHGINDNARIHKTATISLIATFICGALITILCVSCKSFLITLFLAPDTQAYAIAMNGFPLFAISFIFFGLNIVAIGLYQALERATASIIFMLFRGLIFVIPLFIIMPLTIGANGLWLAVPTSEALTFICIIGYWLISRIKNKGKIENI